MKHVQFGLNNENTVLEKKVKVHYVPCTKANVLSSLLRTLEHMKAGVQYSQL